MKKRDSASEDRAHRSGLHHWTEGLIIVHTRPLGETPENSASLVALQCAISPTLMRPDPLASHHIATRRTRHEVPRLTLGMKYRIPSTEPNLPRTEPKVPKPKYSVPCSVPSSGEPNLPRYIRFCISVNRSTELVPNYASSSSCYVFVMYLWTTLLHIYSNLLM